MEKIKQDDLKKETNVHLEKLDFSDLAHLIGGSKESDEKEKGKSLGINCCNGNSEKED